MKQFFKKLLTSDKHTHFPWEQEPVGNQNLFNCRYIHVHLNGCDLAPRQPQHPPPSPTNPTSPWPSALSFPITWRGVVEQSDTDPSSGVASSRVWVGYPVMTLVPLSKALYHKVRKIGKVVHSALSTRLL